MSVRLAGTLEPEPRDPARERVRVALIALISGNNVLHATPETMPWYIDDSRGTVRDNAGALVAYIDPTALHLVAQLQAYGVA